MYGIIPVFFLFYGIMPKQLILYLNFIIFVYFLLTIGIIAFKAILFVKNNFTMKKSYEISIPELQEVANKMNLKLSSHPFWLKDTKKIKAQVNQEKKTITFGKEFLNNLTSEEKKFVGGHEFFHIYRRQELYILITFVPTFVLMFLMPWILHVPLYVIITSIGSLIISACYTARSIESIADLSGAQHVIKEVAISALGKAYPRTKSKILDFHPHVKIRIRSLDKYYSERNKTN